MSDDRKRRTSERVEDAEKRASTSMEFPTNVTRSTQDLTIGGSEKQPEPHTDASPSADQHDRASATKTGASDAEQAVENQERALESGEESPG